MATDAARIFDPAEKDAAVATVDEAAAMLRVSSWSVYRMIERGELKAVKVGSLTRIPTDNLRKFLAGEAQ